MTTRELNHPRSGMSSSGRLRVESLPKARSLSRRFVPSAPKALNLSKPPRVRRLSQRRFASTGPSTDGPSTGSVPAQGERGGMTGVCGLPRHRPTPSPLGLSLSKPPRVLSLSKELSLSKPPRVLSLSKELSLSKPPRVLSLLQRESVSRLNVMGARHV